VDSKVRIIDEIVPRFRKIADPVERDLYEKEICRLLDITSHAFRKRMGGMELNINAQKTDSSKKMTQGISSQETLLALVINYPEARDEAVRTGIGKLFSGDYLVLAQLVIDTKAQSDNTQAFSHLPDKIENPEQKTILSRVMVSDAFLADIDWRNVFDQCSRSTEKKALGSIKGIAERLAVLDADSEEYALLLKQADGLRKRKSEL
jgi:DNA primase